MTCSLRRGACQEREHTVKRTAWLALGGILVVAACGGTSTDLLGDGGASGDGAAGGDGGNGDGGTRDGAIVRGDGGGSCPDLGGSYSLSHTGDGCGDLSTDVIECLQQDNACRAQIKVGGGGGTGLEAAVTVGSDGSFDGANVKLGSADRSGCTGTWDQGSSTLTIDCGGTGTSQSCVVTLTRTSTASCN